MALGTLDPLPYSRDANLFKKALIARAPAAGLSASSRQHGSQTHNEMADDMGASAVVTMFFHVMGGLGLFFTGVGVLWFVTVYKEKKE